MAKKIIIPIIVILILVAGGVFWLWQDQAEVRELNKNLPEGVRVVKNLIGNEYKVVNKIDGYEFKVPEAWKGVKEIFYLKEIEEEIWGHRGSSINIEGIKGVGSSVTVNYFETKEAVEDLKKWAEDMLFNVLGFEGELTLGSIGGLGVVKTQENSRIFDNLVYFFKKDSAIYAIVCESEEFIKEIILNGKW